MCGKFATIFPFVLLLVSICAGEGKKVWIPYRFAVLPGCAPRVDVKIEICGRPSKVPQERAIGVVCRSSGAHLTFIKKYGIILCVYFYNIYLPTGPLPAP